MDYENLRFLIEKDMSSDMAFIFKDGIVTTSRAALFRFDGNFRTFFNKNPDVDTFDCYKFPESSCEDFNVYLDYVYNRVTFIVDEINICQLAKISFGLDWENTRNIVEKWMEKSDAKYHTIFFLEKLRLLNCQLFYNCIKVYIQLHFKQFFDIDAFDSTDPEILFEIFDKPFVEVNSNELICITINRWIEYDFMNRKSYWFELLDKLDLKKCSLLFRTKQLVENPKIYEIPEVVALVLQITNECNFDQIELQQKTLKEIEQQKIALEEIERQKKASEQFEQHKKKSEQFERHKKLFEQLEQQKKASEQLKQQKKVIEHQKEVLRQIWLQTKLFEQIELEKNIKKQIKNIKNAVKIIPRIDKNILLIGGGGGDSNSILKYNIKDNIIKCCGNLNFARKQAGSELIDDKLFIFGGFQTKKIEVCSINTQNNYIAKPVAEIDKLRANFSSAVLNKKIWIIGGTSDNALNNCCNVVKSYDMERLTSIAEKSLPVRCCQHDSLIIDNIIYVTPGNVLIEHIYRHDQRTNCWDKLAKRPYKKQSTAVSKIGGNIACFGGLSLNMWQKFTSSGKCQIYDVRANKWRKVTSMPIKCGGAKAVELNDKVMVFGGQANGLLLDDIYNFNKKDETWSKSDLSLNFPNSYFTVAAFGREN